METITCSCSRKLRPTSMTNHLKSLYHHKNKKDSVITSTTTTVIENPKRDYDSTKKTKSDSNSICLQLPKDKDIKEITISFWL